MKINVKEFANQCHFESAMNVMRKEERKIVKLSMKKYVRKLSVTASKKSSSENKQCSSSSEERKLQNTVKSPKEMTAAELLQEIENILAD